MEQPSQKILVIRFSSIGDLVLCSPIVRCLKKQTGAEIHLLTKKRYAALYEDNPYVDQLWTIDKEVDECLPMLKNRGFDYIVDLHKNWRSFRVKAALKITSYSFDKINLEKWLRVYTRMNFLPNNHLVDRYFDGVKQLGIKDDGLGLDFFYSAKAKNILDSTPYHNYNLSKTKFLVIALGANFYTKRVPKHLVKKVLEHYQLPVVLIGGSDVAALGEELSLEYKMAINLCGKVNIAASAAIVDHGQVVITGDTGMMHIAAALKKPIVVVWGSTHRQLGMYPYYGDGPEMAIDLKVNTISCSPCSKIGRDRCPLGHKKCLTLQEPEQLIQAIDRQILAYP